MKLRLRINEYKEWLYHDPEDPLGPAKIRDDAPEWAKKLFEEDTKMMDDLYKQGYI